MILIVTAQKVAEALSTVSQTEAHQELFCLALAKVLDSNTEPRLVGGAMGPVACYCRMI
jgi:hypothetical protein